MDANRQKEALEAGMDMGHSHIQYIACLPGISEEQREFLKDTLGDLVHVVSAAFLTAQLQHWDFDLTAKLVRDAHRMAIEVLDDAITLANRGGD
jgi:hypothetical protein